LGLSKELKDFISQQDWIFAKTYAETYPHEYIVQERVDSKLFILLAQHISANGYEEFFYKKKTLYLEYDGYTYWHIENIINRCVNKDTYHQRKLDGRLPN